MSMTSSNAVVSELRSLIEQLDHGARLPTVRDLMRRFSVSQGTVQEALRHFRDAGSLSSHVGRGTFVIKAPTNAGSSAPRGRRRANAAPRQHLTSLLMLTTSRLNERSVIVQNGIQAALSEEGGDVVQMSYQDADQLLRLLRNAPEFSAAILQSHYEMMPVRLLSLLQEKCRVVVADGHSMSGIDLDVVGTDWSDAIDDAVDHLTGLGHRSIGLVTIDSSARPLLAARRYFTKMRNWRGTGLSVHPPMRLSSVSDPAFPVQAPLRTLLAALLDEAGQLPFTALLCLGISDGAGVRQALRELDISVPGELSVHLLGHCDVPSEHYQEFSMSGPTSSDTVQVLVSAVRERLARPGATPKVTYLPIHRSLRASTAAPA